MIKRFANVFYYASIGGIIFFAVYSSFNYDGYPTGMGYFNLCIISAMVWAIRYILTGNKSFK